MATVLATHRRRAAHGRHQCSLCRRSIAAREVYEDQRCADYGTVYAIRSHLDCISAYSSWDPDWEEGLLLQDLSDGHLPPCPLAWNVGEPDTRCSTCKVE